MPQIDQTFFGYPVRREQWRIAGELFDLTWPADMDALLDDPKTHERFNRDEFMPYWAQPWPASVMLAETILRDEAGGGRRAADLGCGIGLVALAASRRGWQVTAMDYDPDAVAFCESNARNNSVKLEAAAVVDYRTLWTQDRFDAVFAADLLYERRLTEPVVAWIASALKADGFALLSDPNRSAADAFPEVARAAGFQVEVRDVATTVPGCLPTIGRVWRLSVA